MYGVKGRGQRPHLYSRQRSSVSTPDLPPAMRMSKKKAEDQLHNLIVSGNQTAYVCTAIPFPVPADHVLNPLHLPTVDAGKG